MLWNQIRLLTNDKYKPEIIEDMPTQVFKGPNASKSNIHNIQSTKF